MSVLESMPRTDEKLPGDTAPEVEVRGDEALIRKHGPEGIEERKVKLPKATWA